MQQYYRTALGMCLLIAYLQAQPVPKWPLADDLSLDKLDGVSCKPNATFTSPEPLKSVCRESIQELIGGWKNATENCNHTDTDSDTLIHQTLEALSQALNDSKHCNLTPTTRDHENFTSFLDATKEFVQFCNSQ